MVRRGSTVRGRQRASSFRLLRPYFRCLRWRRHGIRRPRSVHQPPRWTFAGAELVEQTDRVLVSVAGEVTVVVVDHGEAGADVAGQVGGGDAGTRRAARPPSLPTRSLPLSRPARHGVTRATKTSCVLLSPPGTPSPTKIG